MARCLRGLPIPQLDLARGRTQRQRSVVRLRWVSAVRLPRGCSRNGHPRFLDRVRGQYHQVATLPGGIRLWPSDADGFTSRVAWKASRSCDRRASLAPRPQRLISLRHRQRPSHQRPCQVAALRPGRPAVKKCKPSWTCFTASYGDGKNPSTMGHPHHHRGAHVASSSLLVHKLPDQTEALDGRRLQKRRRCRQVVRLISKCLPELMV